MWYTNRTIKSVKETSRVHITAIAAVMLHRKKMEDQSRKAVKLCVKKCLAIFNIVLKGFRFYISFKNCNSKI